MTTANELAKQTLEVLDTQKEYFKTRSPITLTKCYGLEKKLRNTCNAVLAQQHPVTGDLFNQQK